MTMWDLSVIYSMHGLKQIYGQEFNLSELIVEALFPPLRHPNGYFVLVW